MLGFWLQLLVAAERHTGALPAHRPLVESWRPHQQLVLPRAVHGPLEPFRLPHPHAGRHRPHLRALRPIAAAEGKLYAAGRRRLGRQSGAERAGAGTAHQGPLPHRLRIPLRLGVRPPGMVRVACAVLAREQK